MRKYPVVALIAGIITVLATTVAWYVQISEKRMIEYKVKDELVENRYKLEKVKDEIDTLLKQKIAEAPQRVEIAALDQKFKNLEEQISSVKQQSVGLRQAINPFKPEEILTIARLTDYIKALRKDLQDLESKLSSQQKSFQDSILRELKSSGDSTTLILVVLIPLVLNFLYTVWKDFKSSKNE